MPVTFDGKLVVAISSRALFDFEEENRVFERDGESAYVTLQLGRLDVPAKQGVAFPLVKKLLSFNTPDAQRVEVVILSKNDPVSGLRVFRSAQRAGLRVERGVFTRGRHPYRYLDALRANLFLSANEQDVNDAAHGIGCDQPQEPQDNEDNRNGVEHDYLPFAWWRRTISAALLLLQHAASCRRDSPFACVHGNADTCPQKRKAR